MMFCLLFQVTLLSQNLRISFQLMVFQIQLAKAVDTLPLTRDYMADYDIQTQPA